MLCLCLMCRRLVWGNRPSSEMPPTVALGGGMVAGAIGSVITMPFDVLKTKMQSAAQNIKLLGMLGKTTY